MRTGSCHRNPPGSSRSSPMAWSTTCWTEISEWRMGKEAPLPPPIRNSPLAIRLLQRQRDEAQFAFRVGHEQERRLAALLLQRVDALLHHVGVAHRLLRHLDD